MGPMNAQPQFDDVDDLAHVFDETQQEDEWKIRLPRKLGVAARERARHDGITLTELTKRALEFDDSDGSGEDNVRLGRTPKTPTDVSSWGTSGRSNSLMISAVKPAPKQKPKASR